MSARVLVTGARGNVGRPTLEVLRAAGIDAIAAGRRPDRGGVRLDFRDPTTFASALAGIDRVFLLRPPDVLRVGHTINRFLDVAARAGVGHCVFLSVEGAERNPRLPHHRIERHLRASGLAWTFLRPGFFAQNLTGPYLSDIRRGRIVLPAGDGAVAWVDTRDLGEAAALILANPDAHARRAYHTTGGTAVGFSDVAHVLSETLRRRVEYTPVSVPRYALHLLRGDARSLGRVAVLSLLHVHVRRGSAATVSPDLATLLGRPPRTIDQFVDDHRAVLAREGSTPG